ncbi:MAG: MBL fold metallo-hydrolase [Parvularculaceae bacterium]
MRVTFHGVRGSAPAPGAATVKYGGDTPCVEVASAGRRLFLDAGSGMRNVRVESDEPGEFDLIVSHYHYDHLIGLPFFEPLWRKGGRLRIWAPRLDGVAPQEAIERIFSPPYCPVELANTPTKVEIRAYTPGASWRIAKDLNVSTAAHAHPGGAASIKIESGSASLVYATDVEIAAPGQAGALAQFAAGASLFIVDAMSTDEEAEARRGWGHSTWREAARVAAAARVERAALFHHDPRRKDCDLDALEAAARQEAPQAFFARQETAFDLGCALTASPPRDTYPRSKGECGYGDAADPVFHCARGDP